MDIDDVPPLEVDGRTVLEAVADAEIKAGLVTLRAADLAGLQGQGEAPDALADDACGQTIAVDEASDGHWLALQRDGLPEQKERTMEEDAGFWPCAGQRGGQDRVRGGIAGRRVQLCPHRRRRQAVILRQTGLEICCPGLCPTVRRMEHRGDSRHFLGTARVRLSP